MAIQKNDWAWMMMQCEVNELQRQIDELVAQGPSDSKLGRIQQRKRFMDLSKRHAELLRQLNAWANAERFGGTTGSVH
jgi:hypothetical protein